MQEISSRRGVYSAYCAIAMASFLVLLSNVMGFVAQTSYGEISRDLAIKAGYDGIATTSFGRVIDADAGTFVHLGDGSAQIVTGLLLLGLLGTIVCGALQRSPTKAVLPGLVFIVASAMMGTDYFSRYDMGFVGTNVSLTVAVAVVIGGILATLFREGKLALIPRAPDSLPGQRDDDHRETLQVTRHHGVSDS